jgi:branched-chain amino acid transport system substrate-binding protein
MLRSAGLAVALASAACLSIALPERAAAEIRIGLAAPLTGRMAPVGLAMQRALEAAVRATNAAGGVLGQPLVLIVEDDGCASATAEGAARQLLAAKPVVVLGHPCSNAATATAALYGQAGVLLIAVGPRHPDVTRAKAQPVSAPVPGQLPVPPLRLAGRDDKQGEAAAAWLFDNAPNRRMAIIHDRTTYARGIVDGALAALKAAAVEPVAVLPIVAGKRDYEDVARALRERGAEDVLLVGYPDEAVIIVSAIERLGFQIRVLGTDSLATPDFANFAARAQIRLQVLLPAEWHVEGLDDAARAQGARARGGFEAWIATAGKLGTIEGSAVGAALRGTRVMTRTMGEIEFNLNGDLDIQSFAPASARAGRWVKDD